MYLFSFIILGIFILNMIFSIILVFLERKDPVTAWAWILVLTFLPVIGFILYIAFGQNITRKKAFDTKIKKDEALYNSTLEQIGYSKDNKVSYDDKDIIDYEDIINMHLNSSDSILTQNNEVEIFTDGKEKFKSLINAMEKAKDHIHLMYYIIENDDLARKIVDILTRKAKDGVKVRLLYDSIGSKNLNKEFFKSLIEAGGKAMPFFPSKIHSFSLRLNYRNHRKLVIVDGTYGFIGGFNIENQCIGIDEKNGYWRDTHLKITGDSVHDMQIRFLLDWRFVSDEQVNYQKRYYPKIDVDKNIGIQIVTSGPDSDEKHVRNGLLKMINSAKKYIYIQTPYFIPDKTSLECLKIAAISGVDVKIMIPFKSDSAFVDWSTYSYAGELLGYGAKVYVYKKGFLHAKSIVVDSSISSVGTANFDVRSFKLNFEVNAFIYNKDISLKLKDIFENDLNYCKRITFDEYISRSNGMKFKESFSRLFSPIL